jgi:hypothetical protein
MLTIDRLDHFVLTGSPTSAIAFTRVLGMRDVTFGAGRGALAWAQKINLHLAGRVFAAPDGRRLGRQTSRITAAPLDAAWRVEGCGVTIEEVRSIAPAR